VPLSVDRVLRDTQPRGPACFAEKSLLRRAQPTRATRPSSATMAAAHPRRGSGENNRVESPPSGSVRSLRRASQRLAPPRARARPHRSPSLASTHITAPLRAPRVGQSTTSADARGAMASCDARGWRGPARASRAGRVRLERHPSADRGLTSSVSSATAANSIVAVRCRRRVAGPPRRSRSPGCEDRQGGSRPLVREHGAAHRSPVQPPRRVPAVEVIISTFGLRPADSAWRRDSSTSSALISHVTGSRPTVAGDSRRSRLPARRR